MVSAEPSLPSDASGFVCKLGSARTMLNFAKAIGIESSVLVNVDDNGLKLSTEDAKAMQANSFLQRDLFHVFKLQGSDDFSFEVSLAPLVEGLSLLGPGADHVLWLRYVDDGLALYVEENGVVVEMSLATRRVREPMELEFGDAADVVAKVIIGVADGLKDLLADLDTTSPEVRFCLCPETQMLTLHTAGNAGSMRIDIPSDSDLVSQFEVAEKTSCSYKSSHLRTCLKPLSMAEKISLRVDARQVLCVQYMVKVEDQKAFVEFLCLPLEDEE